MAEDPLPTPPDADEFNRVLMEAQRLHAENDVLIAASMDMNPQEAIDYLHGHAAKLEGNLSELDRQSDELVKFITTQLDALEAIIRNANQRAEEDNATQS